MGGIAGLIGERALADGAALVDAMCERLRHRGPDDAGLYVEHGCVLGHMRLGILDIASSRQPLANADGSVRVTLDGDIYNYRELREELIAKGHRFTTTGDTEVLVHLYEEEGIDLVERLNGTFAFALWDARRKTVFLARDRLGMKPLYYHLNPSGLAFASELKALLCDPSIPRDIDQEALAEYLTLSYVPQPRTPFAGIRKLASGTWLSFHAGTIRAKRYWRPPAAPDDDERTGSALADEIRELIVDATRLRLRADVPVGVLASGGIDSAAIMWAASRQEIPRVAYRVELDDVDPDTPYARLAAQATGTRLAERQRSYAAAGRVLPALVWHLDEPLADPAAVSSYLRAREVAQLAKVVLDGTGADELFGGHGRYGEWASTRLSLPGAATGAGWVANISALVDFRERYLRRLAVFWEPSARRALRLESDEPIRRRVIGLFEESTCHDPAGAMMFVDQSLSLPDDRLMVLDKTTMAVGLEARVPLLDHRLVEMVARLPGRIRMRDGRPHALLRETLHRRLPDAILDRPNRGGEPALQAWMRGPLGAAATRLLSARRSALRDVVDPTWIAAVVRDTSALGCVRAWHLLILELWWRTFVEREDLGGVDVVELAEAVGT